MDGKLPVIHYEKVQDPIKDLVNAVNKCPTHSFAVRHEGIEQSSLSERKKEEVTE